MPTLAVSGLSVNGIRFYKGVSVYGKGIRGSIGGFIFCIGLFTLKHWLFSFLCHLHSFWGFYFYNLF